MSHLLKEYRGKVQLIYIDPPFDSRVDYKMKVELKGKKATNDISTFEEKQYGDIWTNDEYLQFMYERIVIMKTMVDRFGEDVTTLAYDMTSFRVQTEVSASPTFFGWVFGFNGKVQILAPERVKEQYRQMIAKADENMQESE